MDKKLRIGLVGCGGMGRNHLERYARMEDVEVVALCDILPEKLKSYSETFGVSNTYADFNDLIAQSDIDAVDITTPNYLHSVIAVAALSAGKHVFSEKPDAVSVEEVLKMQKAAETAGRVLMVMRNNRFVSGSQYLKEEIRKGVMGDIYSGRCGWQRRRGIPGKGGWFTTKAQSGGGPLIDLGVHMIDLAIWLMGNPTPVTVSGSIYSKFAENTAEADSEHANFGSKQADGTFDVEDLAMGFIKFDNGACLQIEFSWASNIKSERAFVELRGSKAGFTWEDGKVTIFGEKDGKLTDTSPDIAPSDGHGLNLRHFADVVLYGKEPIFVPQQGVDMIKILTAIYKSAETGREIVL